MTDMKTRRGFIAALMVAMATGAMAQTKTLTPLNQPKGKLAKSTAASSEIKTESPVSDQPISFGGQSPASKQIKRLEEFKYLTPAIQKLLLEQGEYTLQESTIHGKNIRSYILYSGYFPEMDADYTIKLQSDGRIDMKVESLSERNLLGHPSGFVYKESDVSGFQPDAKLLAKLPETERNKIELTVKIFNRNVYLAQNYPFCTNDFDLSNGSQVSGRVSRDLRRENSETYIDEILQANGIEVSREERELYGIFGYLTTTEESAKARLRDGGYSLCQGTVGDGTRAFIIRGLAKYPSRGASDPKTIQKELMRISKHSRSWALSTSIDVLNKVLAGNEPKYGDVSREGKEILKALRSYCSRAEKGIERLDLTQLKPKGNIGTKVVQHGGSPFEMLTPADTQKQR
ncbi:MAG: hypothetical protein PHX68_03205 [Alphaproteobacteria bacterium]|nr:hypothetical protein [Alphaproteobacteria bacterium]